MVECFCAGEVAISVGGGLEVGRDHHLAELGSIGDGPKVSRCVKN